MSLSLIFFKSVDLVLGLGADDRGEMHKVMESMAPDAFHWGSVLWPLLEKCVGNWRFEESDLDGHASAMELGQFSNILASLPSFDSWKTALKSGQ